MCREEWGVGRLGRVGKVKRTQTERAQYRKRVSESLSLCVIRILKNRNNYDNIIYNFGYFSFLLGEVRWKE